MPDAWDFTTSRRTASPLPLITYGLAALCVLFTLAHWTVHASPLCARIDAVVAPTADQIWDGAYWGLVTTVFVHGDVVHILFDVLYLVQLGRAMELQMSPWAYIGFVIAAAAVSQGCEIAILGDAGIGASGVVYAMFGLMWIGRYRYRSWGDVANQQNMVVMLIWGVYCIFSTVAGFMLVANAAHFGGLLFGLAAGWLFLAPRRKLVWAAPMTGLVLLTAVSLFWLPWSNAWLFYRAGKRFDAKDYRGAIALYHRSLRLGGDRYDNWENIRRAWLHIAVDAAQRSAEDEEAEALRQAESAQRLEGPDPVQERAARSAEPTLHVPGRKR